MASYYKKIDGKDYDKAILDMAKSSVAGQGDGRISLVDAKRIVKLIQDGGRITDIEKRSLQYILKKYKFTDTAIEHIKQALGKAGAAKEMKPVKEKAPAARKKSPAVKKAKASAGIMPAAETKVKAVEKPEAPAKEKKSLWKCLVILFLLLLLTLGIYYLYSKYKNRPAQPQDQNASLLSAGETGAVEQQKASEVKSALEQKSTEKDKPVEKADGKTRYVVKENDTLVKISIDHYNDYRKWELIWKHNKGVLKSPVLIFPGQVIELPEDK